MRANSIIPPVFCSPSAKSADRVPSFRPAASAAPAGAYTAENFAKGPFVVFYEVTRACDLKCKHCRACAQPDRHPNELTHDEARDLLEQFASFEKPPVVVFTGGDPMKRPDILELVRYGVGLGLQMAITPSATPQMTREAVFRLKDAGLSRLAVSLDSHDPGVHDAFRGVPGSFDRTLRIIEWARDAGLPVQINTTITCRNVDHVDDMAEPLARLGIVLWSVFFLISGRARNGGQRIRPEQYETVFEKLFTHSQKQPYGIKTTEAHHYRRFVLMRNGDPQHQPGGPPPGRVQRAPIGVNDGKGVFFVSHTGTVYPSGFMPVACGKFPKQSVVDIYRKSPLLKSLRDGDRLKGKCGVCDFDRSAAGAAPAPTRYTRPACRRAGLRIPASQVEGA